FSLTYSSIRSIFLSKYSVLLVRLSPFDCVADLDVLLESFWLMDLLSLVPCVSDVPVLEPFCSVVLDESPVVIPLFVLFELLELLEEVPFDSESPTVLLALLPV